MTDDLKVSIIIPLYNRENLIIRCLDSCVNQSMRKSEFEIVVIDDCSTDRSYDVVREYQHKYPNLIRLLRLENNSGTASVPRNEALKIAIGEYVLFVDSDDYIDKDTLFEGWELATKNSSDLVILKKSIFSDGVVKLVSTFTDSKLLSKYGICVNIDRCDINDLPFQNSALAFFKRKLITSLGLEFDCGLSRGEDTLFISRYICGITTERDIHVAILAAKTYYFISRDSGNDYENGGEHLTSKEHLSDECRRRQELWCKLYFSDGFLSGRAAKYALKRFRRGFITKLHRIIPDFASYEELSSDDILVLSKFLNDNVPNWSDSLHKTEKSILLRAMRDNNKEGLIRVKKYIDKQNYIAKKERIEKFIVEQLNFYINNIDQNYFPAYDNTHEINGFAISSLEEYVRFGLGLDDKKSFELFKKIYSARLGEHFLYKRYYIDAEIFHSNAEWNNFEVSTTSKAINGDNLLDRIGCWAIENYTYYGDGFTYGANKGDIVLDIGAFTGSTALYFSQRIGADGKVYAFEATPATITLLRENIADKRADNVTIVPLAVSDKVQTLHFPECSHGSNSALDKGKGCVVAATTIDIWADSNEIRKIDFIKMDIEGAERYAIQGAKNVISKFTPMMAISIYHRQDDFWTIPNLILSINPKYKMYLNHGSKGLCETVCFFIPSNEAFKPTPPQTWVI